MATAGILRAANVVFYHPLDDFVESAVGQTWTGTGGFVAGKIGSANSAVTADAASWGSIVGVAMESHDTGRGAIVKLTSTTAVVMYVGTNGSDISVRVATVSGSDLTFGPEHVALSTANGSFKQPVGAAFSSTKIVLHWRASGNVLPIIVGTVSGTDITFGTANTSISVAWATGGFAILSSTKAVLVYGIFSPTFETKAVVVEVSGTDVTVGASIQLSTNSGNLGAAAVALDSTRALGAWNNGTSIETAVLTASGADVTSATPVTLVGSGATGMDILSLSSTKVVYVWLISGAVGQRARVADISGTDITFGAETGIQANVNHGGSGALSSSTFVVVGSFSSGGIFRRSRICTVSGTDITVGGLTDTTSTVNNGGSTEALSATSFLHMTTDEVAPGVVGQEAAMTAPTPASYPDATGNDRVAVAMWAKDITPSGSTVTVQRDFTVVLTPTTIALGPATATWSGAGVATVMSSGLGGMNDGASHLLVLDFEHTGGGTWTLRTSIDGAAFTSQGSQTSGTRSTAPAGLTPGLAIAAGDTGQWVDELVMWAGDTSSFAVFETQELANLFDLADTFDEPMNQFEENFGAPLCWQATATMPDGTVWRDSGSGSCPAVVRVPRGAQGLVVTDGGIPANPRIIEG